MADTNEQKEQGGGAAGADVRSENLLPADSAGSGEDSSDDGRFEVAEEVNLDEQSDATRRVGKLPEGSTADALADVYKSDDKK